MRRWWPAPRPRSAGQLGGLLGVDGPGVEQVQVARPRGRGQVVGIGQAGGRVFGGEAGDVVGRLHRLAQRRGGEVRGAGVAAALAQVDAHAQRLVAVALDVLEFALAHRHRQAHAFGDLGAGVAGAQLAGQGQGVFDDLLELLAR
jgi:hypothetical protein